MRRLVRALLTCSLLLSIPHAEAGTAGDLLWQDEFAILEVAASDGRVGAIGTTTTLGIQVAIVRIYDAKRGTRLWQDEFAAQSVILDKSRVVVAGQGVVRAYDVKTGVEAWLDHPPFTVTQLYRDGPTTIATASSGAAIRLRVYDTTDGTILVADQTIALTGISLFHEGRIFAIDTVLPEGRVQCRLQAASIATGELLWEITRSSTCIAINGATDGKRVYLSGIGGAFPDQFMVQAYDAASGAFLWEHRTGSSAFQDAAVDVDPEAGLVYAVGWIQRLAPGSLGREDFAIKALDVETGTPAWEDLYGDAAPFCLCHASAVVVEAGTVYGLGFVAGGSPAPPPTSFLRAYDAKQGAFLWQQTFAEIEAIVATRGEVAVLTPGTAGDDAILRVFSGK
jgi:outer membrane protein assembly factor BamB